MTNQIPHRKMRPKSETAVISPAMIIGGVLIVSVLFIIAVIVALSNDDDIEDEVIFATNTPAPLPTYANGNELAEGDTLYVVEPVAFSFAVGAENTNEEQTIERCAEVIASRQGGDGELVYLENNETYWIYARLNDEEKGWNGWLPLSMLSNERPADCES